jgi:hypothetical protein
MILYYSDKKVGVPFSLPASLVNLWNSLAFFVTQLVEELFQTK